jgi:hypothetical protein
MTIAAILAIASKYALPVWNFLKGPFTDFLKENWKQISYIALLAWAIMCILSHCSGVIDPWGKHGNGKSDTISVRSDTIWAYPDSTVIFALYGFDTIPRHIERLNDSIRRLQSRFRPTAPVFPVDGDCSDSVATLRAHSDLLTLTLDECDEAYHDAIAIRTYGDTLRNDSIEVAVNFRVEGRLRGEPSIRYRYLAPYPVITNTVTLKDPPAPPRHQVYIGGGIGPRLAWEDNSLNAIIGSAEAGFTNRKNLSMGLAGDFTQNDYGIRVVIRKGFFVGK